VTHGVAKLELELTTEFAELPNENVDP